MDDKAANALLDTNRFLAEYAAVLSVLVAELGKELGGRFPNHIRRLVHDRLPSLSDKAMAAPETLHFLQGVDLFLDMFPPPDD